jgi:hypothetical protein
MWNLDMICVRYVTEDSAANIKLVILKIKNKNVLLFVNCYSSRDWNKWIYWISDSSKRLWRPWRVKHAASRRCHQCFLQHVSENYDDYSQHNIFFIYPTIWIVISRFCKHLRSMKQPNCWPINSIHFLHGFKASRKSQIPVQK